MRANKTKPLRVLFNVLLLNFVAVSLGNLNNLSLTVHALRPSDIKVIAALGDSITVGNHPLKNFLTIFIYLFVYLSVHSLEACWQFSALNTTITLLFYWSSANNRIQKVISTHTQALYVLVSYIECKH